MYFLLFILAWVLFLPVTIFNCFAVLHKYGIDGIRGYFKDSARRIDIYAAGEFRTLWNLILITHKGISFDKTGKTISYYLGANQHLNSLSAFGKIIVFILDFIDKEHCKKAFLKST